MGKPHNLDQSAFRAYEDDAAEGAGTPIAALNADFTQLVDVNWRLRVLVAETNGGDPGALGIKLQYELAGGGWNDVTGSSNVVKCVASTWLTEGADCSQVLGSGSHFADNNGQEDNDGTFTTGSWPANQDIETEFCLQIVSGDVVHAQTLQLRLVEGTGTLFTAYTNTPTITVSEPIDRLLAGQADGSSLVEAALSRQVPLAADSDGICTATATLQTGGIDRLLAAEVDGICTVTPVLAVTRPMAADVAGVCTVTPILQVERPLAAEPAGAAAVTGGIVLEMVLAGAAAGASTVTATLAIEGEVLPQGHSLYGLLGGPVIYQEAG